MGKKGMKKASLPVNELIWIILAVLLLVIGFYIVIVSKKQGISALDFLKNLFRFRR